MKHWGGWGPPYSIEIVHGILGGPSLLKNKGVCCCNDSVQVVINSTNDRKANDSRIQMIADKHTEKGKLQNKVLLNARLNPVSV